MLMDVLILMVYDKCPVDVGVVTDGSFHGKGLRDFTGMPSSV
jgi:hypothetical protein